MMECESCKRRRVLIAAWIRAGEEWARNPTGPSINEVFKRIVSSYGAEGEENTQTRTN